jgi:hypothetical protein
LVIAAPLTMTGRGIANYLRILKRLVKPTLVGAT